MEYSALQKAYIVAAANGGTLRVREGTTVRVDFDLAATAFDVSGEVATARGDDGTNPISSGNPLTASATAAGAWDNYQVLDSSDAVRWSGDSGDLTLSVVGDTVELQSWTHTIPNPA